MLYPTMPVRRACAESQHFLADNYQSTLVLQLTKLYFCEQYTSLAATLYYTFIFIGLTIYLLQQYLIEISTPLGGANQG